MYDRMWDNINRHILVTWLSLTALIASIGLFTLVENSAIPREYAKTGVDLRLRLGPLSRCGRESLVPE